MFVIGFYCTCIIYLITNWSPINFAVIFTARTDGDMFRLYNVGLFVIFWLFLHWTKKNAASQAYNETKFNWNCFETDIAYMKLMWSTTIYSQPPIQLKAFNKTALIFCLTVLFM